MNIFTKIKQFAENFLYTRTVNGPQFYFQTVLTLFTTASVFRICKLQKLSNALLNYVHKKFNRECVIHHNLGYFSVNAKNDSFTKSLSSFEDQHHHWLNKATDRKYFVDIGANIGFYSILAVKRYGYRRVVCFEPNPDTFNRLHENIYLNTVTNRVRLEQVGLGEQSVTRYLHTKPVHTGASSFVGEKDEKSTEVPMITFDEFARKSSLNAKDISFIKIDVEGYEYEVLRGMDATLRQLKSGTPIFIEIRETDANAEATKNLLHQTEFTQSECTEVGNYLYVKN